MLEPLTACFDVQPPAGSIQTTFAFDASCSTGPTAAGPLEYRWDWDGDGAFDTGYSLAATAAHQYPSSGTWSVTLEVKSPAGRTATATIDVIVTRDILGVYLGSGTATNTGCTDPDANTTFHGSVRIEIKERTGNSFSGSMTFSFTFQGVEFVSSGQMVGIIDGDEISGTHQASLGATRSIGTFNGRITDTSISLEYVDRDIVGDTCTTTGQVSGTKQ